MFKKYIQYLKDNPEHYWFKRKIWGWGWVPATQEGWAVIGLYILAIALLAFTLHKNSPAHEVTFNFVVLVLLLTVLIVAVCYKKGEKPKWQWGFNKKNR